MKEKKKELRKIGFMYQENGEQKANLNIGHFPYILHGLLDMD